MKKILKIAAIVVVGILLILIVLPFVFNVNAFRPKIESELSSGLGREVRIGDLSLSLITGSLRADNITIADDPAFSQSPFVKAQSLSVGVELLPLITSKTLHVTSLKLEKPEVTLLSASGGRWNFSSLGSADKKKQKKESSGSSPDLSIKELKISGGRINIGLAGGRHRTYEDVNLRASNVSFASEFPFTLDAKTPGGGKVNLEGKAGPIDEADTSLTPLEATIKVASFDLASSGFVAADSGVGGLLDYDGKLLSKSGVLDSSGVVKTQKLKLSKAGAPASKPINIDYATGYDLRRQTGTLKRGAIRTGNSAVQLTGSYDNRGSEMVLHMALSAPGLPVNDVQALLPVLGVTLPSGSSLQGGTLTARLSIDGPLDRLVIAGPASINNTKLAGFNLGSKMSAMSILTGLKVNGNDTTIETLSTNLRVAPEGIRTDALNAVVSGLGTINGNGMIGADNSLNYHMLAKLAGGQGGGGLLGGLAPGIMQSAQKNGIAFAIRGTTANPQFVPDMGSVVGGLAGGLLGGGQQTQKGQQQQQQPDLGGILGGLLGGQQKKK